MLPLYSQRSGHLLDVVGAVGVEDVADLKHLQGLLRGEGEREGEWKKRRGGLNSKFESEFLTGTLGEQRVWFALTSCLNGWDSSRLTNMPFNFIKLI